MMVVLPALWLVAPIRRRIETRSPPAAGARTFPASAPARGRRSRTRGRSRRRSTARCPPRQICAAVERGFDFTAQDEVRLLERVIVEADADAGLILDEQHAVMARAQLLVDHPLEEHALQAAARLASLVCPRNLARVVVAEQIAVRRRVGRCQSRCRRGYRSRGRRRKKCVTVAADGLRLRSRQLQPSCWFVAPVPPGV